MNQLLRWKVFLARSWFLGVEETQNRAVGGLQTLDWPLLISNVAVPPSNSWYHYTRGVFFDDETNLAVINLVEEIDVSGFHYPKIQVAQAMLDHIARSNQLTGCTPNTNSFDYFIQNNATQNSNVSVTGSVDDQQSLLGDAKCWIPIVVADLAFSNPDSTALIEALSEYENPPAVFMDYGGTAKVLTDVPPQIGSKGVWAFSFRTSSRRFQHAKLELNPARNAVVRVTFQTEDISSQLPAEVRDDAYSYHIQTLRKYADDTIANDPIIGASNAFPVAKNNGLVRCEAGECEHGNLFTDALRWFASTDFAFANSGAYHGSGWPEGPVRVSNLWEALPFANTLCTGTMTGISVFRMFNFSTSSATFSLVDTTNGGDLLQVSGLRVTYNTNLHPSRLVGLDIWNKTLQQYVPIERLKLYTFASDSYNCRFNEPFNSFSGSALTIPGEVPGNVGPELEQEIVANYLSQLGEPYVGRIEGRLVNDTTKTTPINLFQSEDGCDPKYYWVPEFASCFLCPSIAGVTLFMEEEIVFDGVSGSGSSSPDSRQAAISNTEAFPVDIVLKSLPPFLSYTGPLLGFERRQWVTMNPGDEFLLTFGATAQYLEAGTAAGEVVISVSDGGTYPGCVGNDIRFDAEIKVRPVAELNHLGSVRIIGWVLASIIMITALGFGGWCLRYRQHRVVKTMQPLFLMSVCFGVFVIGSAIIPISFDDEIVSKEGMDKACVAVPWLISMGFTMSFSALFSKLWRINKLFQSAANLRRTTVRERDVLVPFVVLFTINAVLMLVWTLVDPLRWKRFEVTGEPWNTYGLCRTSSGRTARLLLFGTGFTNAGALLLACWQAFKARNISDEFSEASHIGMAIFSWVQLAIVGIPVLFLIDEHNQTARYFVQIGILFGASMSILLWIFVPLVVQHKIHCNNPQRTRKVYISKGVSDGGPGVSGGFRGGGSGVGSNRTGGERTNNADQMLSTSMNNKSTSPYLSNDEISHIDFSVGIDIGDPSCRSQSQPSSDPNNVLESSQRSGTRSSTEPLPDTLSTKHRNNIKDNASGGRNETERTSDGTINDVETPTSSIKL